jgi:prophage regulatory protein
VEYPEALLRLSDLTQMVRLSRSEIYRRMEAGRFPRPVQVGEAAVAWRQSEIVRWITELPIQPGRAIAQPATRPATRRAKT